MVLRGASRRLHDGPLHLLLPGALGNGIDQSK